MLGVTRSRKYQITINNPVEHGFTHDVLRANLSKFSGLDYWCMADEIGGETGTLHTHVYLASRNPLQFHTVHQRFYGAHIESAKGSHQENRDYIRKEGKWAEDAKHETSIPGTFEESGELPPERDAQKSQSEEVLAMLDEGADNETIIRRYPTWIKNQRALNEMRQTLLENKFRSVFRPLSIQYIWGKTGVGKTRGVMDMHGYENVFRVTNYQRAPFDGYSGQDVLLFDEFRSSLPIADMLKYLDGYPLMLPCRYGDRIACYTKVYLLSNIPMEKQYPNIQLEEPETWHAFLRRFSSVSERLPPKPENPEWAF